MLRLFKGTTTKDWFYDGYVWKLTPEAAERHRKRESLRTAILSRPGSTAKDWKWNEEKKWWEIDNEVGTRLWREYSLKHGRNPRRRNPVPNSAPSRALLCIGQLRDLELYDPRSERTAHIKPKGKWLAWDGKQFQICNVKGQVNATLPSSVVKKHKKFHAANPQGRPFLASMPDRGPTVRDVGLLKSLVYYVPSKIRSPGKNKYLWHHAFGDTGHKGGDSYPIKVMPMLQRDSAGNLFIKRRAGNIFRVDTWLRG